MPGEKFNPGKKMIDKYTRRRLFPNDKFLAI